MTFDNYESRYGYEDPKISSGIQPIAATSGTETRHRLDRIVPIQHIASVAFDTQVKIAQG